MQHKQSDKTKEYTTEKMQTNADIQKALHLLIIKHCTIHFFIHLNIISYHRNLHWVEVGHTVVKLVV